MKKIIAIASVLFLVSCNGCNDEDPGKGTGYDSGSGQGKTGTPAVTEPKAINYTVVNIFPHDSSSFTQGLELHDGVLYEGTGLEGKSHLMKVNLKDGVASKKISLDPNYFGEGITILNDKIYQLTWQNHKVLVYDLKTWNKLQEFDWAFEGWGITNNGKELIISTGSNNLYFVDPANFKILNTISVFSNYGPEGKINELEYVDGKVYANVWFEDHILVINPQTGAVEGKIDFTNMIQQHLPGIGENDVLNGIAYDAAKKSFYITGKRWPSLFEVKLN